MAESVKDQETTPQRTGLRSGRRGFLRLAAGGGLAASAALVAGCGDDNPVTELDPDAVVLDFSDDFGVLNYAYALEQLEAAFYAEVVAALDDGSLTLDEVAASYFRDLAVHEDNHRLLLQQALGDNAIAALTPDFEGADVDFTSAESVLDTAQALEDTGVGAYNGAGRYLESDAFLTLAGKIVSVEARHAAAIRAINADSATAFADLSDIGAGANVQFALDTALTPQQGAEAASGFIVETLVVRGL